MTFLPQMEKAASLPPNLLDSLFHQCAADVAEAVRLCRLDSTLSEELDEMKYLQAGLNKSLNTNQYLMGVLWLRDRLLASCHAEGSAIDYHRMDAEFSTLKKVVGLPKHAPMRGVVQPVALAPAFQGVAWDGSPLGASPNLGYPSFSLGQSPPLPPGPPPAQRPQHSFSHGGRGHAQGYYGPGRGGGRGWKGGRGGPRQPPFCGKCQRAGYADIRHSHVVCPLTICKKCGAGGHVARNCTN